MRFLAASFLLVVVAIGFAFTQGAFVFAVATALLAPVPLGLATSPSATKS